MLAEQRLKLLRSLAWSYGIHNRTPSVGNRSVKEVINRNVRSINGQASLRSDQEQKDANQADLT
jgi:hypothetical protein